MIDTDLQAFLPDLKEVENLFNGGELKIRHRFSGLIQHTRRLYAEGITASSGTRSYFCDIVIKRLKNFFGFCSCSGGIIEINHGFSFPALMPC